MGTYVVSFQPKLAEQIDHHVQLASEVWADAKADYNRVSITAGNYAGFGSYDARCHASGTIEFPIGNASSLLAVNAKRQLVVADGVDDRRFFGVLLHEIGHHVVNSARVQPWDGIRGISSSTHLCGSWLWICCTAWNHFHKLEINPATVAGSVMGNRDAWVDALRHFSPFAKPPALNPVPTCRHCGCEFQPKRSDAKFCSARCRVAANRATA